MWVDSFQCFDTADWVTGCLSTYQVGGLAKWHSGICCISKVSLHRARLVLGWVTIFCRYTTSICNQPTRSTLPCMPPGLLNRVLALIGCSNGRNIASDG